MKILLQTEEKYGKQVGEVEYNEISDDKLSDDVRRELSVEAKVDSIATKITASHHFGGFRFCRDVIHCSVANITGWRSASTEFYFYF